MEKLAGILALVFLCFGLIASYLLNTDLYYFSSIHLVLGSILVVYFIFRGGFKKVRSSNVKKLSFNLIYIALFFTFIIGLNFLVKKQDLLYFDSTKQKVFSLAPQTKTLLLNLKSKVQIRAFFVGGNVDPNLKSLIERILKVTDRIEWILIDPIKAPHLAEKFGISEKSTLHLSIADDKLKRSVKLVRSNQEQDLVNAILKLTRGSDKKIYWVGGDLEDKSEAGFLFLKEAIQGENLLIEKLDLLSKPYVPKDAAAIILMPLGRQLLEPETKAITEYFTSGGNAVVTTEPGLYQDFLKPSGIKVGNNIVLDEVVKLAEGPTLVLQPVISDFTQHPITDGFNQGIVLTTANSLTAESSNSKITELAFSGEKSWAETNLKQIFKDIPTASLDSEDRKGPISIAVAAEVKGRLVAIGDSDFVNNLNIRQLYNRDFFLNSLNWVVGQQEALSIRASTIQGSTKMITEDQMKKIFLFSALLFPEFIILLGLVLWWRRR